jgi:hypothetical protein
MDLYETTTQSFVLRVWVERPAEPGVPMLWRGHITQLPTGSRRYVQTLDAVLAFIAGYINAMDRDSGSGTSRSEGTEGGGSC